MKKIKATLMVVIAVLGLIAFISPVSAVLIGDHNITFVDHTFDGTYSTWTYEVTSGSQPAISHWAMTWCNKGAIVEVSEEWGYVVSDPNTGIRGIKFDRGYVDGESRIVWFTLQPDFEIGEVEVCIKAGQDDPACGFVTGPVRCNVPIPEFPTIAIPVAAILGLLFFFNHRKRKKS